MSKTIAPLTDEQKAKYLLLCQDLLEKTAIMRNYAMNHRDLWLAKTELGKINELTAELQSLLEKNYR